MRPRNRFSRKEQLRILKEISSGQISLTEAARKYGISPSGIHYWKIHFGMRPPNGEREKARFSGDGKSKEEIFVKRQLEKELEQLKMKVAELYMENEFLKKARDFVERDKKLNSSVVTDQNLSQFVKRVRSRG
jgi:transposase-like protein